MTKNSLEKLSRKIDMSGGLTLEELANAYCVLCKMEPSPKNIEIALNKLKKELNKMFRCDNDECR